MTDTTATGPDALTPPPSAEIAETADAAGADGAAEVGAPASPATGTPAGGTSPLSPRTRWAAIVWGSVLAAIAGVALWITVSSDRREALADWIVELSPAAAGAYIVLVIGALALVAGVVGIARRAQRGLERRRGASAPAPVSTAPAPVSREEIAVQEDASAQTLLP